MRKSPFSKTELDTLKRLTRENDAEMQRLRYEIKQAKVRKARREARVMWLWFYHYDGWLLIVFFIALALWWARFGTR
jgi:hypothetical protein